MSWLSKLGSIFKTTNAVIAAVGPTVPLVAGFLPSGQQGKVLDIFSGAAAVVGQVEAMHAAMGTVKSGSDKLAAAMPFVAGLVTVSDWMFDKKVTDPVAFEKGIKQLTDAVVQITKSVEGMSPNEMNARIQELRETQAKFNGQYTQGKGITQIQ